MTRGTLSIEEATEALIDYRGKTPTKADEGVRLITAKVIKDGRILDEPAEYISADYYDTWMRRGLPRPLDVLVTTEAPLGEVAILRDSTRVALAQRVILLRARSGKVDPRFLYYALQGPLAQAELRSRASGTTVSGIRQTELRQVRIPFTSIDRQRHIAGLLWAVDELIENNLRRFRVLDEMSRALFREWFVDLRFPDAPPMPDGTSGQALPEGWQILKLKNVAVVNRQQLNARTAPNRIRYIDIASVGRGSVREVTPYAFADAPGRARRVVQHGDILWSCVRPNRRSHVLLLDPEPDTVVSTGFAVLTADRVPFTYLYQVTTTDEFVAYLTNRATGAAYPAVTGAVFEDADILLPPEALLRRFDEIARPQAMLVSVLERQNRNLRQTRDLLLPRLLSGQIELPLAEEALAEAASAAV